MRGAIGPVLAALLAVAPALAQDGKYDPGASDAEVKIGQTMPYSGPASGYGVMGKAMSAYFRMINDEGGVNGRKINLISLDDGYSPPRTVEQTRRLVESDGVLAIVGTFGTPGNVAIQKYLNRRKVPQLFIVSGGNAFAKPDEFPWTMGWQPNNYAKGVVYAKFILKNYPEAKVGILYQNDDFGKDYVAGIRAGLRGQDRIGIVKELSYEVSDPTVDSQLLALRSAGANVLLDISQPRFAAQAIRKLAELGWKPAHLLSDTSASIESALKPAGLESAVGVVSMVFRKDPYDPAWRDDPAMKAYFAFMAKYVPDGSPTESLNVFGYATAQTFVHVLKQAGNDLTRANLMKQAASIDDLRLPILLPGVVIRTGRGKWTPISQEQIVRFDGERWVPLGDVIEGE